MKKKEYRQWVASRERKGEGNKHLPAPTAYQALGKGLYKLYFILSYILHKGSISPVLAEETESQKDYITCQGVVGHISVIILPSLSTV